MKIRTKDQIGLLCGLFLLWAILASLPVYAGPDIIQKNENTDGDVTVAGDDSLGLGLAVSLGGVYAEDCYVSDQETWAIVGKQGWQLNRWCAANYYEAKGQLNVAAQLRCSIPAIAELDYKTDCVSAHLNIAPESEVNISDVVNYLVIRQDAVLEETTAPLRDEVENLRQTLEDVEKAHERPIRPQQTIIQQPFLDEAKREALASIRGDK